MITLAVAAILFAVIYWMSPDKKALNVQASSSSLTITDLPGFF